MLLVKLFLVFTITIISFVSNAIISKAFALDLFKTSNIMISQGKNEPTKVIDIVKQDLSNRIQIPLNQITVKDTVRQTWSDGCLGLAKPDELCTQALVEGWKIIVSHQRTTWVYRTDNLGSNIRLESQN